MLRHLSYFVALVILGFTAVKIDMASAQNFSLTNVSGDSGDVVQVGLSLSNNTDVVSATFLVGIDDPSVAEFVIDEPPAGAMVAPGPALDTDIQATFGDVQGDGRLQLVVSNVSVVDLAPFNNGVLSLVSFSITGQPGDSTTLTLELVECVDENTDPVDCQVAPGSITVEEVPPGMVNVTIEKTADTNRVQPDEETDIVYTIKIVSDGEVAAQDVMVTDNLPGGAELVSASGCSETDPGVVECDVGMLPVDDDREFTITIRITPEGASILNQAIVAFLGGQNSDSVSIRVGGGGSSSSGCALATGGSTGGIGLVSVIALLLIAPFAIGIRRLRGKCNL